MLRSVLAVLGGYITLIIGVSAFFAIVTFADPELLGTAAGPPPTWLLISELLVSFAVAVVGGYVCGLLAPARPLPHSVALALLMGVLGVLTAILEAGLKPWWSSAAMAVVAPGFAVLGGWLRARAQPAATSGGAGT